MVESSGHVVGLGPVWMVRHTLYPASYSPRLHRADTCTYIAGNEHGNGAHNMPLTIDLLPS